jgi:hypothetical protein
MQQEPQDLEGNNLSDNPVDSFIPDNYLQGNLQGQQQANADDDSVPMDAFLPGGSHAMGGGGGNTSLLIFNDMGLKN